MLPGCEALMEPRSRTLLRDELSRGAHSRVRKLLVLDSQSASPKQKRHMRLVGKDRAGGRRWEPLKWGAQERALILTPNNREGSMP